MYIGGCDNIYLYHRQVVVNIYNSLKYLSVFSRQVVVNLFIYIYVCLASEYLCVFMTVSIEVVMEAT